jgi:phosphoribosylaminoimidazole-succinocarboxamide synthase
MAVFETDLTLPDRRQGKVRDTYTLPGAGPDDADAMLIVASDRLSAFDVVLPTPIPGKGVVLTEIAAFWLRWIEDQELCRTHLLSTRVEQVPDQAFGGATKREQLEGRVTIGRKCRVIPVECVVRGYLEGSGWKEYQQTGRVCGIQLPEGLRQCDELPVPIFTPATKAEEGHDENIGFDEACAHVESMGGRLLMDTLRTRSMNIYIAASAYARDHGLILADTKFEFGFPIDRDGEIISEDPILIDEALTPDSSRFWPLDDYEPGHAQRSFDKQFVREYLESLVESGAWSKSPPGPELPSDVIEGTIAKYREARDLLIGSYTS